MIDRIVANAGRIALYVLVGLILVFLILPSALVVPMSLSPTNFLQFPPTGFSTRW